MYVCMYVRTLPAWRPHWPHTSQREGTLWSCCHITRSESEQQLHVQGHDPARSRCTWLGRGYRGWVTTELRLNNNYDYCAKPGPGLRRTEVATAAERLPVCACRAKQTACWMSRQIQVNSRGNCDGAATTSARQTSVAFATGRTQNAAQRSQDRQPEPLLTPRSRDLVGPPLSSCELVWLARLLTPWDCIWCSLESWPQPV